jgi:hypothetical protein
MEEIGFFNVFESAEIRAIRVEGVPGSVWQRVGAIFLDVTQAVNAVLADLRLKRKFRGDARPPQ